MISREPTLERLATAKSLLLTPFGLDESHLARALAEIKAHQVDEADLYFQYTRSEGWSLEEGIVKTGSFQHRPGRGRARRQRRENGVCLFGRHLRSLAAGCGPHCAVNFGCSPGGTCAR